MVEVSTEGDSMAGATGAMGDTGNGQGLTVRVSVGKMVARYKVPGYLSVYWFR
jgi:hypothetical protein